jgi:hypothetical protein
MTVQAFDEELAARMHREPFARFDVERADGRRFRVTRPFSVSFRKGFGKAVDLEKGPRMERFNHASITCLLDADIDVAATANV